MNTDQLTLTFAALADPTRRAILARLAEGEATVNELAEPFPIIAAGGLQAPEGAGAGGADRARQDRQLRPSRLQGEALKEAAGVAGGLPAVLGRELRPPRRASCATTDGDA